MSRATEPEQIIKLMSAHGVDEVISHSVGLQMGLGVKVSLGFGAFTCRIDGHEGHSGQSLEQAIARAQLKNIEAQGGES